MMNKPLLIAALCLISLLVDAQTGTYKKILSENSSNLESLYDQLSQFQKENVEFGNVYYQLGKVELNLFASLDPIVERVESRQRVYNAKTNFGLATNYLDERDISRFPEWYDVAEGTGKDSITIIGKGNIESRYKEVTDFSEFYEELIENYDRAVFHYLKAREGFIGINNMADNLRDLFLQVDDSLKTAVREVGVSFDSSMYHMDKYRAVYQKLPHVKKRKVEIKKQKIDHFRMNGITPANFLADEINVWDYKEWSERFLNLLKEEVDGLHDEIIRAYEFFIDTNQKMVYGDDCIQAELDEMKFQRIINLITKYDNESVLIDIFKYLTIKLDYGNKLVYERVCNAFEEAPTDDLLSRKARIFQNLFVSFDDADSLNQTIVSSGHTQTSFQWFFDEMMPGENGSGVFSEDQKKENYESFKSQLVGLMNSSDQQRFRTDSSTLCFEIDENLLIGEALPEGNFCPARMVTMNDELTLFQGVLNEKNVLLGASPVDEDFDKLWELETYKNSPIDFFKVVGDSSYVIGGIASGKAWITQLSENGGEFYTTSLKSADPIKNVMVNQLQGVATILQQGASSYTLSKVNFNGKVQSTKAIQLAGEFVGMFKQDTDWWIFTHELSSDGSTIMASSYNENEGSLSEPISYSFEGSMFDPTVIRNDNEYLTVLSKNSDAEDEIIYALINYEGEIAHETVF